MSVWASNLFLNSFAPGICGTDDYRIGSRTCDYGSDFRQKRVTRRFKKDPAELKSEIERVGDLKAAFNAAPQLKRDT